MNTTDEEILSLAALYHSNDLPSDYGERLDQLNRDDWLHLGLACKIVYGRRYSLSTDNPETVRKLRAFAKRIGAIEVENPEPNGFTKLVDEVFGTKGRTLVVFAPLPGRPVVLIVEATAEQKAAAEAHEASLPPLPPPEELFKTIQTKRKRMTLPHNPDVPRHRWRKRR